MSRDRFIPGIYNYCDYWCERCAFTRRCRNFATSGERRREAAGGKPEDDATRGEFWNQLADQLVEARMYAQAEGWAGDDAGDIDLIPDAAYERREEARQKAVREHPLVLMAHSYMDKAGAWLKAADADLKQVARDLLKAAGSKFAADDHEEQARQIGEMIDVVAWYHTLMPPKLARAVGWLAEEEDDEDPRSEILTESRLHDANGSGKVVLGAIERSAAAWVRLRQIVPKREDEIIEMLALLSRMQRGIHAALPGAQSFIRPGFDEKPGAKGTDPA